MFDIGFTELIVIGVVALIVIGPERLPRVARTAGHLYGRMQRYVSNVKSDISREMQADELRRAGQEFKESMDGALGKVQQQANVVDDYLRTEGNAVDKVMAAMALTGRERGTAEAVQPDSPDGGQHSLPLDEPDQNRTSPESGPP